VSGVSVVVTGLGAVTPAGNDAPSSWAALTAGRSAVRRAPRLEAAGCRFGGHCVSLAVQVASAD